jgi:hypothetical protein
MGTTNYRYKHCVNIIRFPEGFTEEDRGVKNGCCQNFLVLASLTDDESHKNDTELAYIKKTELSDVVTFTIEKCGTTGALTNLGDVAVFGQDSLATGFMFDWKQYLTTYGTGTYTIKVAFTISGIVGGFDWGVYDLKNYSIANASNTIRVKSKFDSYSMAENIDFSNSNCMTTLRLNGYFGDPQNNTEIKQLITKGQVSQKTKRENLKQYELKTNPLLVMFTRRLQFQLLNQDECFISDHNKTNHYYDLFDVPVVLDDSAEFTYKPGSRLADVKAVFGIRTKDQKSFYNRQ